MLMDIDICKICGYEIYKTDEGYWVHCKGPSEILITHDAKPKEKI